MENSRFKFRAWDKKNNEMISNYSTQTTTYPYDGWQEHPLCAINCLLSGTLNDYLGMDLVFMQYTGLKDKNGVGLTEVYEGDIIDENGSIKGSIYEMDKGETDIVIPQLGTKAWDSAYKKAMDRGFDYSE